MCDQIGAREQAGKGLVAQIEAAATQALRQDRSGAIVLGCAGMAGLCQTLQQRLGVPVIDGVGAAVKLAEGLVALGLWVGCYLLLKRGYRLRP